MAYKASRATVTKPRRSKPSVPPTETVTQTINRMAGSTAWKGELSFELSSQLRSRTSERLELQLIGLFSEELHENTVGLTDLVDEVFANDNFSTSVRKRIGARLSRHQQWDVLLHLLRIVGAKKLKSELDCAPRSALSRFAISTVTRSALSTDDRTQIRQLQRDLPTLVTWPEGGDAVTVATVLLEFSVERQPKEKLALTKLVARIFTDIVPEETSIAAINAGRVTALQLANLVTMLSKAPRGIKSAQTLIVRLSKSRLSETLSNETCWSRLSILEIGQLAKTPEIAQHLAGQPAWWSARQRRELSEEGVGSLLRLIDYLRSARDIVDLELLSAFLADTRRPGNTFIREAFDAVVKKALSEQESVHAATLAEVQSIVQRREEDIESLKVQREQLFANISKHEESLRLLERKELQSREQRDTVAQRVLVDEIVQLILATERMRKIAVGHKAVEAFVTESETIVARLGIFVERDVTGNLALIRRRLSHNDDAVLYP